MSRSRRDFVIALSLNVLLAPARVAGQAPAPIPTIGILSLDNDPRVDELRQHLKSLGYVEGRTIELVMRSAADRFDLLAAIASELVKLNVRIIVAFGQVAVEAARKATSTIPIVMAGGADPVKAGFATSLSRPGGNVTGATNIGQELAPKRIELAKELVGKGGPVGVLVDPTARGSMNSLGASKAAARSLDVELVVVQVPTAQDFVHAFESLTKARCKIAVIGGSTMILVNRQLLLETAAKYRVGLIALSNNWAAWGALIGYGATFEVGRSAATYVDRILKGAKPGELPIEQPSRIELTVNLKTAKALEITIPPIVMVRANRVIQ